MASQHVHAAVWVFAATAALVACGAASDAGPGGAAAPAGAAADAAAPPTEDAGPTTTTTIALGSGGNVDGSKLTSTSTQVPDAAAGGTKGDEIGRGPKDIQAIIVARREEARACYDTAVKAHPGIEGNLDVRWTIDPKGIVTDIAVDTAHSDILEPTVGNCVIAIIKKIHFNESPKGFETRAHYPFNFHPRSGGTLIVRPDAGGH
jgi:hypothetical protein